MRMQQKLILLSAVLRIMSDSFPVKADELPEHTAVIQETSVLENNTAEEETILLPDESKLSEPPLLITEDDDAPEPSLSITEDDDALEPSLSITEDNDAPEPSLSIMENTDTPEPLIAEEADMPSPVEAPMFHAAIEYYSHGYYIVKGTFTEFLPDTCLVRPLYSLDGENWQSCGRDWELSGMGADEETALTKLHNQICLNNSDEPLKSYLNGELDSFYLKLHITRENGESYETQAAIIERDEPQPISKEINLIANFIPSMRVRELKPFCTYGRYQITINEDAAPEDVSAFLPDTLPITVGLYHGIDFITESTIDCPITWKPLSFSQLTAGESITISDAAEEIIIPGDTLLNTPMGIFQLDEPLGLNSDIITDEIKLVLNVVSEHENPTGVLTAENNGLELAFSLKPTGATAIRAYTFSANDTEWKELPALPLLDAVNAQPSTANSGYTLVIHKDWEPYQSYLTATASGESPAPFLIGLKIEGGVYDGRQLILPWPGSYEPPLNLPVLGGSGGNEGNAGADNKNDSTEEGQRPTLPQQPTEEPRPAPTPKPEDNMDDASAAPMQKPENPAEEAPTAPVQNAENNMNEAPTTPVQNAEDNTDEAPTGPMQNAEDSTDEAPMQNAEDDMNETPAVPMQKTEYKTEEQKRTQSQTSENIRTEQSLNPSLNPETKADTPSKANTTDQEKSAHETQEKGNDECLTTSPAADTGTDNSVPLLPIAAASIAGICIVTAIHKAAARRSAGTP